MLERTPFYNHHIQLGAKMVDFAGWEMPIQFSTISREHLAVREKCGIFDISHMGQVFVFGPDALKYLQWVCTNNIEKATVGKGIYSHLLNDNGGVIDDIFVYCLETEKFLLVVNASRKAVDLKWLESKRAGFDVSLIEIPYSAGFALQGPTAWDLIASLLPDTPEIPRFHFQELQFGDASAFVARTGYTGEDGAEFFGPAGHLLPIWEQIHNAGEAFGLTSCGLGARDTLRTEVCYPLYGHELDENHSPLEAGLKWVVKMDKGEFIGRDALSKQIENGIPQKLIGFKVESGGVARPGATLISDGKEVGKVTSGTFSPSLNFPIGMAFVPENFPSEGAPLMIKMGTRELTAVTTAMPFYKKPVKA